MVNPEVLQKRMEKVREYLDILEEVRTEYNLEEFKNDWKVYGSSERFLHLCIESLLDIGNHIIADEDLGKVDYYSDIPKILHRHDYISKESAEIFIEVIGFRNILVHDYLDIDLDIVYDILQGNLDDLEGIFKELAQVL